MLTTVCRVLVIMSFLVSSISVFAGPQSFNYQGRIVRPNGAPLEHNSVKFLFQIADPSGSCVIYQEQLSNYNMTSSGGIFDLSIGNNSRQYIASSVSEFTHLFKSGGSLECATCTPIAGGYNCTGNGTFYNPVAGDIRKLKVSFDDGTGWKVVTPDNDIRSVPFAGQALLAESAEKLGALSEADVLTRALAPTCVAANSFLQWNGTDFDCVSVNTSALGTVSEVTSTNAYISVATGTTTPALTLNVGTTAGTVAAGDDARFTDSRTPTGLAGGDLTGTYPNPTLTNTTVVPGEYPKVTVDAKGRVTAGAGLVAGDIPNLDASKITTGNITNNVVNSSTTSTTGSFGTASASSLRLYDGASEYLVQLYPSGGTGYTIRWPANQGGPSTVLQNDGSGNLSWAVPPSAPVTSVAGKTGVVTLTNTDISGLGSSATLDVAASGDAAAGEVVKGDDTRLTNGRAPTGTAGGDLAGTYPNPTVAQIQGRPVDSAAPSADGQALLWDGAKWVAQYVRAQDLRNSWGGDQMIPASSCLANQAMVWSSIIDRFTCQNIANLDAAAIASGTIAPAQLGSGIADTTTYLRGDGTWQAISTTDNTKLPLAGGTMTGAINMSGQQITNVANVPFVATNPAVGQDGQSLRWNNTAGQWEWFTAGAAGAGINTLNGQSGNSQSFAPSSSATSYGFNSSGDVHTFSIPSASTAGVTAGTISKAEFDAFNTKQPAGNYITDLTGDITASGPGSATATIANNAVTTSKILDGNITSSKLSDSGVVAGIYPKVTVDIKGRVTAGAALDPADIPNLDISKITTGVLPVTQGGTGATSANAALNNLLPAQGTEAGKVLSTDGTNTSWIAIPSAPVSSVAGKTGVVTLVAADIADLGDAATRDVGTTAGTVAAGDDPRLTDARTPTGSAGGDLSGTYPNPTVAQLQGRPVDSTAPSSDGQALLWDGAKWVANFVRAQDLRTAWGGSQMIPSASCSSHQAMVWNVITDRFSCQNIDNLDAAAIASGVIAPARLGSGIADNTTYLRGDGTWQTISTTDNTKLPLAGGTMTGAINMGGQQITNVANVPFVATNPAVGQDGQSLRWNNTAGQWEWFTAGAAGAGINTLNGQSGNSQSFAPTASATSYGFNSAADVHTLSIPSASTAGVTAGTISKTEYDTFNAKQPAGNYITDLTGDVTAAGPGSATATVARIRGINVDPTAPTTGQVLKFDGTNYVPSADAGANAFVQNGNSFGAPAVLGTTDDQSLTFKTNNTTRMQILNTGNIAINNTFSGAKLQVSADTLMADHYTYAISATSITGPYQRVSLGFDNTANAGILQAHTIGTTWNKRLALQPMGGQVGVGVSDPTTLLDVGGAITQRSSAAPALSTTGQGRIYFDSTAGKFRVSENGGAFTDLVSSGGGGSVTNVSSANSYITVSNNTTTPVVTANVGTTANTLAAGDDARFTDARTPAGSAGGDLAGTYPNPSVARIQGRAINSAAPAGAGQALQWDGSEWRPNFIRAEDIRTSWGGSQLIPAASCSSNQAMVWNVITDRFTCQNIDNLDAAVIASGEIAPARLGTGTADNTTYLRGDGTWQAVTTTDNTKLPLAGGTMTGAINMGGQQINNVANVPFVTTNPTVTENTQSLRWNSTTSQWDWFTPVNDGDPLYVYRELSSAGGVVSYGPGLDIEYNVPNTSTTGTISSLRGQNTEVLSYSGGTNITEMTGERLLVLNSGASPVTINSITGRTSQVGDDSSTPATIANITGASESVYNYGSNISSGIYGSVLTVNNYYGSVPTIKGLTLEAGALSGTTGNLIGAEIYLSSSGSTTTNRYGIKINTPSGTAANDFAIHSQGTQKSFHAGNLGLGSGVTSPSSVLDVNGSITMRGIAAPALSPVGQGRIYYSSADNKFKVSQNGGAYVDLLSAGGGGTVTNVSSTNSYITVSNNTTTPVVTANVGTAANTLAAGDDARFTDARTPTGSAGGDLTNTYPNPTVAKIRGVNVDPTAPTIGQILKFDGTNYVPSADAGENAFVQNGNSFAAPAILGTNDNQPLQIKTNNTTRMVVTNDGALLMSGSTGVTPASGNGTRMMWIPNRAAFRAGLASGTSWDESNVGFNSAAFGDGTVASGTSSFIGGGRSSIASGEFSATLGGDGVDATEDYAVVLGGMSAEARGLASAVIAGEGGYTQGIYSVVVGGAYGSATGNYSTVINGIFNDVTGVGSLAGGGESNIVAGDNSFAFGKNMRLSAAADNSYVFGTSATAVNITQPNAFIIHSADLGVGNINPSSKLDINGAATVRGLASAPVSPAGQGRIFYSSADNKFKVSQNGGAYVDLVGSGGSGGVTSVGLSLPAQFTVTNSPVVDSGTLTASWASQAANLIFASPDGASGSPSFRSLVANDVPNLDVNKITTGVFPVSRGGTGLTSYTAGNIFYASNTSTLAQLSSGTSGQVLTSNGSGTAPTWQTLAAGSGDILQNGNAFGAAMVIGTNDSQPLSFETSGVDRMTILPASGNVGIGTASPDTTLHVAGQIKITGGSPGEGKVLTSDSTGTASWVAPGAPRVVTVADSTTFTPTAGTADQNIQMNTQASGTLIMAAPTGTPVSGQKLIIRIKSTNLQTFSWNAIYRGSDDLPLPTASSGAAKTDYMGFIYNAEDGRWDLIASVFGF